VSVTSIGARRFSSTSTPVSHNSYRLCVLVIIVRRQYICLFTHWFLLLTHSYTFKRQQVSTASPLKDTEDERMLRESVARFANEKISPKVLKMDEESKMDPVVLKEMHAQGFMGIEIPSQYGGSGLSFTSSIIVIGMNLSKRENQSRFDLIVSKHL
jgi:hypothetical protein